MITTLAEVVAFVGAGYSDDDVRGAWHAAEQYVADRCRWTPVPQYDDEGRQKKNDDGTPADQAPASLVEAVKLQTARYLARKKSPDGMVGMNDFGPVRMPVTDRDVERALAPYRVVVFG
ncbi:hypothetical protein [uncultured Aeromicrobium sp.]|uniref:hypothetical protein n=1 Tax=uncultured Aeromicrobium sp. TaxID=337820 RepID=UPI0025F647E9|nr:hypothetical protein [uncultured Aeromicrobium sp.]